MRKLTEFEIQLILMLKHDLMDSDSHDRTNIKAECLSDIEATEQILNVIKGE